MVAREVVPAIRADSGGALEVIAAGASLGAFMATAVACRYPWLFRAAVGMSGSYDLERVFEFQRRRRLLLLDAAELPAEPRRRPQLDTLRQRFVILAYGGGRWENPEDCWRLAGVLGAKGIPNRVDPWGPEYDHDWPTWRRMLPLYLDDLTP